MFKIICEKCNELGLIIIYQIYVFVKTPILNPNTVRILPFYYFCINVKTTITAPLACIIILLKFYNLKIFF